MEGEAYGRCWYYICSPRMILWLPLTKYTPDGGLSFRITEGLSPCESVVSESVNVSTLCALSKLWRTQEMTGSPKWPSPCESAQAVIYVVIILTIRRSGLPPLLIVWKLFTELSSLTILQSRIVIRKESAEASRQVRVGQSEFISDRVRVKICL